MSMMEKTANKILVVAVFHRLIQKQQGKKEIRLPSAGLLLEYTEKGHLMIQTLRSTINVWKYRILYERVLSTQSIRLSFRGWILEI